MAYNKVILIGRMTKDAVLTYTSNGKAKATFTLAIDRRTGEGNKADFPRVIAWEKTAESIANYIGKGCRVAVEGSLRTDSYKDANGNTVYTTDVQASKVDFIDFKQTDKAASEATAPYEEQQASMADMPPEDSFQQLDEDVPF